LRVAHVKNRSSSDVRSRSGIPAARAYGLAKYTIDASTELFLRNPAASRRESGVHRLRAQSEDG
jgi:hypothetical protein